MKFVTGTWRIANFLHVDKLREALKTYQLRARDLPKYCRPLIGYDCAQTIQGYHLSPKIDLANKLRSKIALEMDELSLRVERKYPPMLPSGVRKRRSAPMLGFIGGIVGPVAGLLTYDDGRRIETEISDLNQAAANISHLMGRQTHVIRAQLDENHTRNMQIMKIQEGLLFNMSELAHELNVTRSVMITLQATESMELLRHSIEEGVDEYIRSADELLDVIHFARRGKLHPALLTSEQMNPVFRDVQDHAGGLDFPIPGPKVSIEELADLAQVVIICKNGTIRLLDRTEFSIYRMHPLPVIQPVLGNGSSRAYVHTRYTHIAMEVSQRTYILLSTEKKNLCKKFTGEYIRSASLPTFEAARNESCESQMLIFPTLEFLRKCDVRIPHHVLPLWTRMETMGAWLYSLVVETSAQVYCPTRPQENIHLPSGTGFIQLAPGCRMQIEVGRRHPASSQC